MSRLIVVSNRVAPPAEKGAASTGGLAMALAAGLRQYKGVWFGWSGNTTPQFDGALAKPLAPDTLIEAFATYCRKDSGISDKRRFG